MAGVKISHIGSVYNIASQIKNHRLYAQYSEVRARLERHQFICWIAGGAVRDFCIGRPVNEFDLVTDASTEVLKSLFPEAILVGESFGVLKIPLGGTDAFDLATFRQESDYTDGRRPSRVTAADPLRDSERRDFTINAMFWDDRLGEIVDYRGGLQDLRRGVLSCVGVPSIRFSEDYLRIMRLVRFAAVMDLRIEPQTFAAAAAMCANITHISGERIWAELKKIDSARSWKIAWQNNLAQDVLRIVLADPTLLCKPTAEKADFFAQLCLWNPERDYSAILRDRLKVSKAEQKEYGRSRFLLLEALSLPLEELAYELENSEGLSRRAYELILQNVLPEEVIRRAEKLLNQYENPLILAQEITAKIPAKCIGEELRAIRISQLTGSLKTKEDVWSYLKKKYADLSEKT